MNFDIVPLDVAFKIYGSESFSKQYLTSLHCIVQVTLGNDVYPQNIIQTLVAGFGLFMGAIINANIFSELALIFQELNKYTK